MTVSGPGGAGTTVAARLRPISWLLLAVAALGGFVVGAQPWWVAVTPSRQVPITGIQSAAGLPQALAAVVAAGLLLSFTLRGWGRVVLGALLVVAGAGAVVLGLVSPQPTGEVVAQLVQAVTLDSVTGLRRDWGGYGFAVAGLLAALGGLGLVVAGRGDPARADRFRRAAAERVSTTSADDDPLEVWRALDAGVDPTAGPAAPPVSDPTQPGAEAPGHARTRSD